MRRQDPRLEATQELVRSNLGRAGQRYDPNLPVPNTTLFAWRCNGGPFGDGVPQIDALHREQGNLLLQSGLSAPLLNAELNANVGGVNTEITVFSAELGSGVLIIGLYDSHNDHVAWISVFSAPNTGAGGPRGTIRVDRGLQQHNADGQQTYTLQNFAGQPAAIVRYCEDDADSDRIFFNFGPV